MWSSFMNLHRLLSCWQVRAKPVTLISAACITRLFKINLRKMFIWFHLTHAKRFYTLFSSFTPFWNYSFSIVWSSYYELKTETLLAITIFSFLLWFHRRLLPNINYTFKINRWPTNIPIPNLFWNVTVLIDFSCFSNFRTSCTWQ